MMDLLDINYCLHEFCIRVFPKIDDSANVARIVLVEFGLVVELNYLHLCGNGVPSPSFAKISEIPHKIE